MLIQGTSDEMSMACNENFIRATEMMRSISFVFLHVWPILTQDKDFF
jgi:hypothetical protein